jgi:hypothetical protein
MTYKQHGYIVVAAAIAAFTLLLYALENFGSLTPANPIPDYSFGSLLVILALMQVPLVIWSWRSISRMHKQINTSSHQDDRQATSEKPQASTVSIPDNQNKTNEPKDKK